MSIWRVEEGLKETRLIRDILISVLLSDLSNPVKPKEAKFAAPVVALIA